MAKEDIERLIKAGFLREKKKRNLKFKTGKKEVSKKEMQTLMSAKKVIFKGYGYVVVKRSKR